eukprot:1692314-Alexandrium_andersonii.AAC.1
MRSLTLSSARAIFSSPAALSMLSNRARHSSEWRVPAAGRRSRTRLHFRHPAVYPCSSSMPWVMFTRLGARSDGARGGCATASCGT